MRLRDFDFDLPEGLIAQRPAGQRDASRLMALDRAEGAVSHGKFNALTGLLLPGDLMVLNDTKVVPARLTATKETGGRVGILVLPEPGRARTAKAMLSSSKPVRAGAVLRLEDGAEVEAEGRDEDGFWRLRLSRGRAGSDDFEEIMKRTGRVPLPPYIKREADPADENRYQTVYASEEGAVAAPTAGLHFTAALLEKITEMGVEVRRITLHVGPGTFTPVRTEDIRDHVMHAERYSVPPDVFDALRRAKREGRRVVAVGTTVARALETCVERGFDEPALEGSSSLFIYPGFEWKAVDALITNFHLPGSTLVMLVAAFAGREFLLRAYAEAVREGYRFYSYGDAMFVK